MFIFTSQTRKNREDFKMIKINNLSKVYKLSNRKMAELKTRNPEKIAVDVIKSISDNCQTIQQSSPFPVPVFSLFDAQYTCTLFIQNFSRHLIILIQIRDVYRKLTCDAFTSKA